MNGIFTYLKKCIEAHRKSKYTLGLKSKIRASFGMIASLLMFQLIIICFLYELVWAHVGYLLLSTLVAFFFYKILGWSFYFYFKARIKTKSKTNGFWQEYPGFLKNSLTCECNKCKKFRDKKRNSILVFRALFFFVSIFTTSYIAANYFFVGGSEKVQALSSKMDKVYETPYFKVQRILDKEVVKGQNGSYYMVDLKNEKYSERILFPTGEFTINSLDERLIQPLNSFVDSVYKTLNKGVECRLYIKGSADIYGHNVFRESLANVSGVDKNQYHVFEILKGSLENKRGSLFANEKKVYTVTDSFDNADLPNLRARFIQLVFKNYYAKLPQPDIFDGSIHPEIDNKQRNAHLYLYVNTAIKESSWSLPTWLLSFLPFLLSGLKLVFQRDFLEKDKKKRNKINLSFDPVSLVRFFLSI